MLAIALVLALSYQTKALSTSIEAPFGLALALASALVLALAWRRGGGGGGAAPYPWMRPLFCSCCSRMFSSFRGLGMKPISQPSFTSRPIHQSLLNFCRREEDT